jgi:hypothetical protein
MLTGIMRVGAVCVPDAFDEIADTIQVVGTDDEVNVAVTSPGRRYLRLDCPAAEQPCGHTRGGQGIHDLHDTVRARHVSPP